MSKLLLIFLLAITLAITSGGHVNSSGKVGGRSTSDENYNASFRSYLGNFNSIAIAYFSAAVTEEKKTATLKVMEESYQGLSRRLLWTTGYSTPVGWKYCYQTDICIPDDEICVGEGKPDNNKEGSANKQQFAEFRSILGKYSSMVGAFFSIANDDEKDAMLRAMQESYISFSRDWRLATGLGCPDGWHQCPDGSCVPDGTGCGGGGFEFR